MWHKSSNHHIDGKMFKFIHDLYHNAKSCVRVGHLKSGPFISNIDVREGENLSPILFSLFLNDLSKFIAHAYNGLVDVSETQCIFTVNLGI